MNAESGATLIISGVIGGADASDTLLVGRSGQASADGNVRFTNTNTFPGTVKVAQISDPSLCGSTTNLSIPEPKASAVIDAHPYLGPGFEFVARDPADAALLHGLFAFNYSGLISLGLSASALSGLKQALPRLVRGVADQLFLDDKGAMLADYMAYAEPEFVAQ